MKWLSASTLMLSLAWLTAVTLADQATGPSPAVSSLLPTSGFVAGRACLGDPVPIDATADADTIVQNNSSPSGSAELVPGRACLGEPIPVVATVSDDRIVPVSYSSFGPDGSASCAGGVCCGPRQSVRCSPDRWWVRGEYLMWWVRNGAIPPLATTSPQASLGVLGRPGTTVLFGGDAGDLDYGTQSGGRFTVGLWRDADQTRSLEGNFFFIGQRSARFAAASPGDPLLGRPFFNVFTGAEDSQQVANLVQPGLPDLLPLAGRVAVSSSSRLCGAEANAFASAYGSRVFRVDLLAGFRYLQLDETLTITEELLVPEDSPELAGSRIDLFDRFGARSDFFGGQVGARAELRRGRLHLDLSGKVALGVSDQNMAIDGRTLLAEVGMPVSDGRGGLLALPSNIGRFKRDRFAVVPEFEINVGYQLTQRLRCHLGYTFLYWSSVARPGNHIDRGVNPTQLPPDSLLVGPARPAFAFNGADFWTQGVNFGLEFSF